MKKRKVLLIGWDAADWKFLNPLLEKGLMPNLQKLMEGGSSGKLATLDPPLSPTLWTSIATGKRPYKHGIHGFTEPDPSGKSIRPIYSTNRKCKAIWNILSQHSLKTHVVGWWPSHPAEPINGTMISNLYHRASGNITDAWPMLSGTVHPVEKADLYGSLRIHPQEITSNHIFPFVPKLDKIDQKTDPRVMNIARTLADCSTVHAAATHIMENEEWEFMGVYYDAIDHFCHGFMRYHAPRQAHVSLQDFELYKDVVNSGCRFHDLMLGRLVELAGEETTIMLISDHGFHPDHNRPRIIPEEPAGPAIEHSPYGVIVMNGPGIQAGGTISGASLLDITPTLLALYDLPVAEDMDGKVLLNVFDPRPDVGTINSWETIEPPKREDGTSSTGMHPDKTVISEEDNQAELQQLIELGYIADPGKNGQDAVKATIDENNYNLARAYIDGQKWEDGINILESLYQDNPETIRFSTRLAHAYQQTGKLKLAREVVNHIRTVVDMESSQLDMLEATLLLSEERTTAALDLFYKIEKQASDQPTLYLRLSNAFLKLNRLEDAERTILAELQLNPEEPTAHYTLGLVYFKQMEYEKALHAFVDSTQLLYYFPAAHFYVGECLRTLENYPKAIEAYDVCLQLLPGMNLARQRIISIYEVRMGQPGRARKYKMGFEEKIKGTITIVSGLPRSGTSMMMQMLDAGGADIFTDQERKSDESNPKGYYEHEAIKSLAQNATFLKEATGKTMKVIAQLLRNLPSSFRYRIVLMERDIQEVVASQQKMLEREGNSAQSTSATLAKRYEDTIQKVKAWAEVQPNVEICYVSYAAVLENAFVESIRINEFLEGELLVERMVSQVDPTLYREKATVTSSLDS